MTLKVNALAATHDDQGIWRSGWQIASLVLPALLLLILGCSYGKGPPLVKAGAAFSFKNLTRIEKGMNAVEVGRLLGPPMEIHEEGDKIVLKYFVHETQQGTTYIFGFLPITRTYYSVKCRAEIQLVADRVIEIKSWKEFL